MCLLYLQIWWWRERGSFTLSFDYAFCSLSLSSQLAIRSEVPFNANLYYSFAFLVTLLYPICFTKRLHICNRHFCTSGSDVYHDEGRGFCAQRSVPSWRKHPMDASQATHEELWNPGRALGRQRYGVYQADFVLVKPMAGSAMIPS
jgi:hypothetical protein